LIEECYKNLS
jgi:hypothetical protein